jgi:RNA polymerase sigma factor (sigma-70 family)
MRNLRNLGPAISPAPPPPATSSGVPENRLKMEAIAEGLARGNEQAFWDLFEKFGPRLVSFFTRRGVPDIDAENLAFECLLNVRHRIAKYERRENGSFTGWVFKIAHYMRIDWWRANGASLQRDDGMLAKLPTNETQWWIALEEDSGSPDEIRQAVYDALEHISERDRDIIRSRYFDANLDNAALAERYGIDVGAAKTRLSRALKRLKRILEKDPRMKEIRSKEL